jgi:RES domain-containing protein
MMKDHPRQPDLRRMLEAHAADATITWERPVYRNVELAWARPEHLVNGKGTRLHGSRWMRKGVTEMVHGASTEGLALKEARRPFDYFGIKRPRKRPRVSAEIHLRLGRVLAVERALDALPWPSMDELLAEDWEKVNASGHETLSQALGRSVWELGFEGMVVSSARDRRGRNVVWFPGSLEKDSECEISGERELNQWLAL